MRISVHLRKGNPMQVIFVASLPQTVSTMKAETMSILMVIIPLPTHMLSSVWFLQGTLAEYKRNELF
jgi:hypothetical protein